MTPEDTNAPRLVDVRLQQHLDTFPAVLITGPRATGKTTSASRAASEVVRLDQPAQAAAFVADPDAALRNREEPLLLDEWQEVPAVLGAVKRAVDADPRPGRFVLTGSVRAELTNQTWPGTGRLTRLAMFGLTEREIVGRTDPSYSPLDAISRRPSRHGLGDRSDHAGHRRERQAPRRNHRHFRDGTTSA